MSELIVFLGQVVVVSLSGVMAPGPVTASAVAFGAQRRHAGAWIAIGHGLVEGPLVVAIIAGLGAVLERSGVKIGIGLAGGAVLLLMGAGMLRDLRKPGEGQAVFTDKGPLLAGVLLSATNPYFLLWWATVGLALATQAASLGILAFGLFAGVHWLCDLLWLEALTWTTHQGSKLLGGRRQKIVLGVCGAALAAFGGMFVYRAAAGLVK